MSTTMSLAAKQIRRSPRRVLGIVLAAILSAMAIMATGTFITTMNAALGVEISAPSSQADAVITEATPETTDQIASLNEVAAAEPLYSGYLTVRIDGSDHGLSAYGIPETESLRWFDLESGEWPAAGEVLLSQASLDRLGIGVGDTLSLDARSGEDPFEVTVSGIALPPEGAEGPTSIVYLSAQNATSLPASEVLIQAAPDVASTGVVDAINAHLGTSDDGPAAQTRDEHVAAAIDTMTGGTQVLSTVFLIFIVIALLAATMVIRNTFQVLLAQRLRENGLLRLIGATGPQIQRTVLAEALLLGVLGSVIGIVLGFGFGWLVALALESAAGGPQVPVGWLIAALLVTVGVTLIAAWAPARSTLRLTPMAALRASATTERQAGSRSIVSWVFGGLITAFGVLACWYSALAQNLLLLIPSGIVLAIGLIVLLPLCVRVIMPIVARVYSGAGTVAKLAGENLVRTSKRSGTVVLAIALGGSLVLGMLTALQSASATLQEELTEDYPVDLVVAMNDDSAVPDEVTEALTDSDAVATVELVQVMPVETTDVGGLITAIVAPSDAWAVERDLQAGDDELLVPEWLTNYETFTEGSRIELAAPGGGMVSLVVRSAPLAQSVQNGMGHGLVGVVSESTLAELDGNSRPSQLWLEAADGKSSDLAELAAELETKHDNLRSYGAISAIQLYEQVFQVVAAFVLAMLGLTVIISAIGLASIIALAVAERRREIALLRALGLTRGGTRLMILIESVSLALLGALFSIVIGIPLGIAATYSAVAIEGVRIAIPWVGVITVIAVAVILGIIAGLTPAQRAAKIEPARYLTAN